MNNLEASYMWVEKYRPKKLDDMVLSENYKSIFSKFMEDGEIPHLLLYGPPGSGKTAISRITVDRIITNKDDCLRIAGSADNGIDVVRNIIIPFLETPPFGTGKVKIVFIDECDFMSQNALASLRNVTQEYQSNGRFIFTCNYLYKIPEPLQSRCQSFEFKRATKEFITNYCEHVLQSENIKYKNGDLDRIVSLFYPDIRKIINTIQPRTISGELKNIDNLECKENLFRSYITDLLLGIDSMNGTIVNGTVQKILKLLSEAELDYSQLYQDMFFDSNIPIWVKLIVNQFSGTHLNAMVPAMHIMSMVYSIIKAGKQLKGINR